MKVTAYVSLPPKKEKPIGGLLDARFKYVPAASTDIRKTLDRVRKEIAEGKRKV